MRILMSGMSGNRGGKETYVFGMSQQLVALDAEVDFMTTDDPMAYEEDARDLGCRVWHIPQRSESPIAQRKAMAEIYRNNDYDVAWSHKTTLSSIEDLEVAKEYGVPVRIVHSHCTQNMGTKFTALMHSMNRRKIGNVTTCRYACSKDAGKYFFPSNVGFEVKKNAFDLSAYKPDAAVRKEYRILLGVDDKLVVGHVGRLSSEKNHKKLLEVFCEIAKKHSESILILCGAGNLREEIARYAQSLGIEEKVLMLGSRDDVPSLLQAFDLFVFPSIHEGLPYAPLEAQAVGVPCVVSESISPDAIYSAAAKRIALGESSVKWAIQCLNSCCLSRESAIPAMKNDGLDLPTEAKLMYDELHALLWF